jgi:hypothetical protein
MNYSLYHVSSDQMRKTILILAVLLIKNIVCMAQDINLGADYATDNLKKACRKQIENKAIGLCNITSDTLTYKQLKQCGKITVNNMLSTEITSYKICYVLPVVNDMVEYTASGNQLSERLVQNIISTGTKKIILSEVNGTKGKKNIQIGYRCFYLK